MGERWGDGAVQLEEFGMEANLSTDYSAGAYASVQCVPKGNATRARNVVAYPGRVTTRNGWTSVATMGADPVSIAEYVSKDGTTRSLLALLNDGRLYQEPGTYAFSLITDQIFETSLGASDVRMNAANSFGREYMGFSLKGLSGISAPLVWDGTNLLRSGPAGPGDSADMAGVEAGAGSISAGVHYYRVCFLTSSGYITPPGPAFSFTSAGAKNLQISGLPVATNSNYVVGRIICASAASDTDLYFVANSSMVINDNTSGTATIDFTDATLLAGTPISVSGDPDTDLLNCIELPQQSSIATYNDRLCWTGERGTLGLVGDVGFRGLSFDGGFSGNRPLGWTEKVAGEAVGSGSTGSVGGYVMITGDGATQKGCLENKGSPFGFIPPGVDIRVRVRAKISAGATGTFHVLFVTSTADAVTTFLQKCDIDLAADLTNGEWRVIDKLVLSAANNKLTSTAGMRITGGAGGGLGTVISNTGKVFVDAIEFYRADDAYEPSLARWSRASQPDAYDAVQGFQLVAQDNGQKITSGFTLGETFYYVKEHSLHATRDDGAREPAFWPVWEISSNVGSPSSAGVGKGDEFVMIAGRSGLYYFNGSKPICVSEHVRKRWKAINWQYGYKVVCFVDMDRKWILVGVPQDSDTTPSTIYCFQWFGSSPATEELKFSTWDLSGGGYPHCFATSERSNGQRHMLMGVGNYNDYVARLDDTIHDDFGLTMISEYTTAYYGDSLNRQLFGGLRAYVRGLGTLRSEVLYPSQAATTLTDLTLSTNPHIDTEWPAIRQVSERAAVHFLCGLGGVKDWFSLERMALLFREKTITPQRGTRS